MTDPTLASAEQFLDEYDKPLRIRDGLHKRQIIQFAEAFAAQENVELRAERDALREKLLGLKQLTKTQLSASQWTPEYRLLALAILKAVEEEK